MSDGAGQKKVNKSSVPRFRRTYLAGKAVARGLHRCRQGWLVQAGARLGLRELLRGGSPLEPMDLATRRDLLSRYEDDIGELETLLNLDLGCWHVPW